MGDKAGWSREEAERHQRNATANFACMVDADLDRELELADQGLEFPGDATDPLAYLGPLAPMHLSPADEQEARALTESIVAEKGPQWVWRHRWMLRHQLNFVLRS